MTTLNEKKLNLLVVDDDDDLLVLFFLSMRSKGYDVEISRNADTFWEDIDAQRPDVIIMDIHMKGIDGRLLCKKLKSEQRTSKIPIILLSANADVERIANQHGANGFIEKPFSTDKVIKEVDRILGHI